MEGRAFTAAGAALFFVSVSLQQRYHRVRSLTKSLKLRLWSIIQLFVRVNSSLSNRYVNVLIPAISMHYIV